MDLFHRKDDPQTIWTKPISEAHGRIFDEIGVDHLVYPEHDMGRRIAHLVKGAMLDFIQFEPDFAMVKTAHRRCCSASRCWRRGSGATTASRWSA